MELLEMEESFGNALHLIRALPIPVVVRLHGPWFLTGTADRVANDAAFRRRVEQEGRAIEAAAGVSAPSQATLDAVRRYYQLDLPNARVIPNPINVISSSEYWQPELASRPTILFVGRFSYLKGGDVVLKAFDEIARELPDARLVFIGPDNGVSNDSHERLDIHTFLKRNLTAEAQSRIEWLDRQSSHVIEQFRREAAVTIVASRFENFPYTLLEAMRVGSPVVATDTGGIPEVVRDGKTGLLVPPGDASALAGAVLRLLNAPAFAAKLGAVAAEDVAERFNPDKIAQQTLGFYNEVIERWKSRK